MLASTSGYPVRPLFHASQFFAFVDHSFGLFPAPTVPSRQNTRFPCLTQKNLQ
jgi:hypothetical protein